MRGISILLDDPAAPTQTTQRPTASGGARAETRRERERLAILQRLQAGAIDALTAARLLDDMEKD